MATVQNPTSPPPPEPMQPPLQMQSPVTFNTKIFDRPNGSSSTSTSPTSFTTTPAANTTSLEGSNNIISTTAGPRESRPAISLQIEPNDRGVIVAAGDEINSATTTSSSFDDPSLRHDPFSSTCPSTPPIYSPTNPNGPYFFSSSSAAASSSSINNNNNNNISNNIINNSNGNNIITNGTSSSQTPNGSNSSTTTTLHPQSRTLSIQSLISNSTNATLESSLEDEDDNELRQANGVSYKDGSRTDSLGGFNIDDPDVRMAAEALGDLRADFIHSPPPAPMSPPSGANISINDNNNNTTNSNGIVVTSPSSPISLRSVNSEEPLINLIGGAHPLIGHAVNAGRNVYRGGKRYSPRFRYGAEIVERATMPMTNVVSYAAQRTGVEGVLRRTLQARQTPNQNGTVTVTMGPPGALIGGSTTSSIDAPLTVGGTAKIKKRRKTTKPGTDMDVDEVTSVADEEEEVNLTHKNGGELVEVKSSVITNENWQRRLMLSTAGAGVALSEESLKSLKFCLEWCRWANVHLDKVIVALRSVLDEWDSHNFLPNTPTTSLTTTTTSLLDQKQQQMQLQSKIDSLRGEVVVTLKKVVDVVSKYAGGALPEHARVYVKACLTSLPRRFALIAAAPVDQAQQSQNGDTTPNGAESNGRNTPTPSNALTLSRRSSISSINGSSNPQTDQNKRVMLLAKEGLDMLHQVSSIVEGTLVRAEEWCDRLGRRKPSISSYGQVGWEKNDIVMNDAVEIPIIDVSGKMKDA